MKKPPRTLKNYLLRTDIGFHRVYRFFHREDVCQCVMRNRFGKLYDITI